MHKTRYSFASLRPGGASFVSSFSPDPCCHAVMLWWCLHLQNGFSPLHLAAMNGRLPVVKYLVEKAGANVLLKSEVR